MLYRDHIVRLSQTEPFVAKVYDPAGDTVAAFYQQPTRERALLLARDHVDRLHLAALVSRVLKTT